MSAKKRVLRQSSQYETRVPGLPNKSQRAIDEGNLDAKQAFPRARRKASMIVDNSTGEIKGIGGMGFWWEEEVDTTRFVKLFLDGIKQAAGLSKTAFRSLSWSITKCGPILALTRLSSISMSQRIMASATGPINAACVNC